MRYVLAPAALLLATLAIAGCRIDHGKSDDGDNVKVATPFGGLQVKTDPTDVLTGLGLPTYPGATAVKKDKINGKDNGSADVNMSFGSFQLRVKAVEFHTTDDSQLVFAFYKKALGRYGDVIQCENDKPVGSPVRTREGLACGDDHYPGNPDVPNPRGAYTEGKNGVSAFNGHAKVQLKAGSKKHQHIVDINPDGSGANFGLVALDLPGDFNFGALGDDDKKEDKSQ